MLFSSASFAGRGGTPARPSLKKGGVKGKKIKKSVVIVFFSLYIWECVWGKYKWHEELN